ncbi:MAG: penicillin-binding protein, partial [Thermodesulfobacteriota bacterium]|nr:penicillin-binding protein [Thermodesulfobacteriota bacterium]
MFRGMNKNSRLRLRSLLAWIGLGLPVLMVCAAVSGSLGITAGLYVAFSQDLPSIPDLRAYRPKTVSTFYADDGSVIGLFYKEKRFPISIASVPPHVVNAFLAAEDARFFSHTGLDIQGVFRAFVRNLKAGNFSQGGSTITQQVTRNLLLSREKKISRKVREAILAYRVEKTLSKSEILELYLNEIYLGKGAYGVESASGTYFGKNTKDLDVCEAAFIAGLAANPSKFSQAKNLHGAQRRKEMVLERMARNGFISEDEYQAAVRQELAFREELPTPFDKVPYFTEAVRQYIVSRYGENSLYNEGLQIWTTCDLGLQQAATESLIKGSRAWEKRQGRPRGLVKRLEAAEVQTFLARRSEESYSVGDVLSAVVTGNQTMKQTKQKKQSVDFQDCVIGLEGNRQERVRLPGGVPYRPNDLVRLRVAGTTDHGMELELLDVPPVQGALICIENRTGFVKSLVGGLDFDTSNFNRATQALRQPGSAFKAVLFAAALEYAALGPYSLVVDEPIAIISQSKDSPWIPSNSDGGFQGILSLSQALARSRNTTAVKVFLEAGAEGVIRMARDMGIRSALGKNPSLSLGASEVTLMELTGAYTVFPNLGMKMPPVLVKKVVDRYGRVLEDNTNRSLDLERLVSDGRNIFAKGVSLQPEGRVAGLGVEDTEMPGKGFPTDVRGLSTIDKGPNLDIQSFLENSFPGRKLTRFSPERV